MPPSLPSIEVVAQQLKLEFIGLDSIIDRLQDAISAWLMAPDWQMRPRVINIWGMTGTGKTSLIKRWMELLHLNQQLCTLSMAQEAPYTELVDFLNAHQRGVYGQKPPVILLDEFQMAGHENEYSKRSDERTEQIGQLFQWLDTGKWEHQPSPAPSRHGVEKEYALYKACLDAGVRTKNGYVHEGIEHYTRIYGKDYDSRVLSFGYKSAESAEMTVMPWLVGQTLMELLYYQEGAMNYLDESRVRQRMEGMSDEEVHAWICQAMQQTRPSPLPDAKNALVFVIGNLDKAFQVEQFNEESSPDLLHQKSLQTTISSIHNNLYELFRKEWVARLGSEHLIMPCLTEAGYRQFLRNQLEELRLQIMQKGDLELHFEASIEELLYREGVHAVLGIRMLQQAIQNILVAQVPRILWLAHTGKKARKLVVKYRRSRLELVKTDREGAISVHTIALHLHRQNHLDKVDRSTMACVAVHECGHALLYVLLFRAFPTAISCVSNSDEQMGAMESNRPPYKVKTAVDKFHDIVVLFGGMAAEQLLFGEAGRTAGSQNDIERATLRANRMVQMLGLGSFPYALISQQSLFDHSLGVLTHGKRQANRETADLLYEAKAHAEQLLLPHRETLRKFAQELLSKQRMNQQEVKDYLSEWVEENHLEGSNSPKFEEMLNDNQ